MSVIGHSPLAGASGAAAGESATYVDDVFSTYVYEGTGSTQSINNGIDLSGEGGLVWIKNRSTAASHVLFDTERGASTGTGSTQNKALSSNLDSVEGLGSAVAGISSFNSNGFTLDGSQISPYNANGPSGEDYVSWTFRKAPGFFDVVTYTGNGTSGRTISHNLGSVPGMIMLKQTSSGSARWFVYHRNTGNGNQLNLNTTNDAYPTSAWNNTTPTSTEFTLNDGSIVNGNGKTYVAYLFAHDDQSFGTNSDEAIIKCASYTGTGSSVDVNVGFEVQWVLIKNISNASDQYGNADWTLYDMMRPFNADSSRKLHPNTDASDTSGGRVFPTATGFRVDNESNIDFNASGDTYVYMAIRRPNKPPEAGTDVFAVANADGSAPRFNSGFPVDFAIEHYTGGGFSNYPGWGSRLQGQEFMKSSSTASEANLSNYFWDYMDGWNSTSSANTTLVSHMFKRAPGFFDMVAYEGDGSDLQTVSHNLGAVPELMIVKARNYSGGRDWAVYSSVTGNSKFIYLHRNDAPLNTSIWRSTTPTSTQFTVGASATVNNSGTDYIAYLFATLNGISKIGSYTGTGSNVNVDCGFTAGARFVLIRRTDSSGDWYVWDTLRGIVSGNDPYLLLNTTDAQVTNTDYIDPLNAGFTVTSSAPAALNTSGGTYLFLAIA